MKGNIRKFSAPWSTGTWILTLVAVVLIFAIVPAGILWGLLPRAHGSMVLVVLAIAAAAAIPILFIFTLLFAPRYYLVTDSAVAVVRRGPDVVIEIQDIQEVRRIEKKDLGFAIRTFGVGGFCGAYGYFYGFRLGSFTAYITNTASLVLIEYGNSEKIILSPDDPDEFVRTVNAAKDRCPASVRSGH